MKSRFHRVGPELQIQYSADHPARCVHDDIEHAGVTRWHPDLADFNDQTRHNTEKKKYQ